MLNNKVQMYRFCINNKSKRIKIDTVVKYQTKFENVLNLIHSKVQNELLFVPFF